MKNEKYVLGILALLIIGIAFISGCLEPSAVCGDEVCDESEDCETCGTDCGPCPEEQCGNGICKLEAGEHGRTCPEDCCEADCTAVGSITCNFQCKGYKGCDFQYSVVYPCQDKYKGEKLCTSPSEYITCCLGPPTQCQPGQTCLDGNCVATDTPVYDDDSGLYMEKVVKDKIDHIRDRLKVCGEDCEEANVPIVSLGGTDEAIYRVFLNGKKVRVFHQSFYREFEIVYNSDGFITEQPIFKVDGTNTVKFLIPEEGEYFKDRYDVLTPNEETNVRYEIVKRTGNFSSAYFFILENDDIFDLNKLISAFDEIAEADSSLAGLEEPNPYYVILTPYMLGFVVRAQGGQYIGDRSIILNYGGERLYDLKGDYYLTATFAHEYAHILQENFDLEQTYQDGLFFNEGMADAIAIYNGYKEWSDIDNFDQELEPGCSHLPHQSLPHTLGRCIFKHLDQEGYLTDDFFYRLFRPQGSYQFSKCNIKLDDPECTQELNDLLSYLTRQDMTSFMEEKLLANVPS